MHDSFANEQNFAYNRDTMKIALVHDHLTQDGGAEKVLEVLQDMFPDSPTFTLVYDENKVNKDFRKKDIRTSFIQKFPLGVKKYHWFLIFMPAATEQYDLTEFDVVISSTSAFAKGIITKPESLHICYCHTPTRYLWTDSINYIKGLKQSVLIKKTLPLVLTKLRQWDRLAAERVNIFIANSTAVQSRIKKYYHRNSIVIHPPVNVEHFTPRATPEDFFLTGGRLVPYKRFDLSIEAFNRTGFKLKIFGEGPQSKELRRQARKNIEFLGHVDDRTKKELYEKCQAFINPQVEDFGITTIEAMAAGRPVIAFAKGGATETVIEGVTGTFFHDQSWEELADILIRFDHTKYDPITIHKHAMKFNTENFTERMNHLVVKSWKTFQEKEETLLKKTL